MKQIRKFEQDSIVNQIMEGVHERLDTKIEKAKKSKDYKAVEKLADVVVKLQKEIEVANQKRSDALNRVNEAIGERYRPVLWDICGIGHTIKQFSTKTGISPRKVSKMLKEGLHMAAYPLGLKSQPNTIR